MLQIRSWPNVILHLDGDAFFASVIQAVNPQLKGKPVVTGRERGIATAISYEARKYGITRAMRISEIKKICPECIIVDSDYELYDLFGKKMFSILRSFTPYVEEYSIDEAFADLKGLQRPLNMSYHEIGKAIKDRIESSLGISVSVGISLTKSLAKLASSFKKPSGFKVVDGPSIESLLEKTPVGYIWGIGYNTTAYLQKLGIYTALQFTLQSEEFITSRLTKPFFEIWRELRGDKVYELNTNEKKSYQSITRSQTFHPPTNDVDILWARLFHHVEDAFYTARNCQYQVKSLVLFLKTQEFKYHVLEITFQESVAYPFLVRGIIKKTFQKLYQKKILYRSTGCTLTHLQENTTVQPSLFTQNGKLQEKVKKIYQLYEAKKIDFGSMFFDKSSVVKEKKKMNLPMLATLEL
ncbi:DNA polymerase IV [Candidatus Roizmanbacteria bacterium]|nr:DNA polymerase IV [Candidatus Roizmanbacteria bacterium]